MSELEKLVREHVTQLYYMFESQEGTLAWYTKFGSYWRELIRLYPDPSFIASLVSVQQTPSPPESPAPLETQPSPPPVGSVHYLVDVDTLRAWWREHNKVTTILVTWEDAFEYFKRHEIIKETKG